ncbi:MAG: carbamate kinase [Ectothiorhodospiraceae bacterium]|nr:carbamate kinase [Chromatiales bacterium]MCP5154370.1 carbamate kinase [Ectothiorhodospiraceae bacterium]
MRIVAALGGNALLRRGETADIETQRRNVAVAARALAPLARDHQLVVTHGNGPQIGLLALQAAALDGVEPYPLDVLGAETDGMLGYLIERALAREVPGREVVTVLTCVEVDPADPAFARPTKPVGPIYPAARATALARDHGFTMVEEPTGWRRAVASPLPRRIVQLAPVRTLLETGHVVVCAGGGGIPVAVDADGSERGVEAVVDKDRTSALLAEMLGADRLLLLTDVDAVRTAWPPPAGEPIRHAGVSALEGRAFDAGSMGPKVGAACDFVRRTGQRAAIGALADATRLAMGDAGTQVEPDPTPRV